MRDRILSKIRKLLRLARGKGTTPAEAASAAATAQRLMEEHRITEAMLGTDDAPPGMVMVWSGKRLLFWRRMLWAAICEENGCAAIVGRSNGRQYIAVCGRQEDVEFARALVQYLVAEIDRLCVSSWVRRSALQSLGVLQERSSVTWKNSFRTGAVWEVDRRMREAKESARAAAPASSGWALVVLDERLARSERAVEQWAEQNGKRVKEKAGSAYEPDSLAFEEGVRAGSKLSLKGPRASLPGDSGEAA